MQQGLVALHKPEGKTSFEALRPIKKRVQAKKVGHAGTLDRFASGLLLVLCGQFTRLNALFEGLDKTYSAVIRFGTETDTLDPSGDITRRCSVPSRAAVEAALPRFHGNIEQTPPAYSAVHVGGRRAYHIARQGGQVQLQPRTVRVEDLRLRDFDGERLMLELSCSKGTYVRSLARDLGEACGSCAHVEELSRTRIGRFTLEEAVSAADFDPDRDLIPPESVFSRLDQIEILTLLPDSEHRVLHGQPMQDRFLQAPPQEDGLYALFSTEGRFVAVVQRQAARYSYRMVASQDRVHR
jgi:tRNA pseudouridine55 synthase